VQVLLTATRDSFRQNNAMNAAEFRAVCHGDRRWLYEKVVLDYQVSAYSFFEMKPQAQKSLPIEQPDRWHLNAAEGWLGLGNYEEANKELAEISPEVRGHPEVLKVQYEIHAALKKWDCAAEIARTIAQVEPDEPFGVVKRAYALHEIKQTEEALEVLLPAVDCFPEEWIIPYNLACYSCQTGDLTAAWKWLERAFAVAGKGRIRATALDDPDLEPLWPEIRES
jgi:predicted Zn-dependent protease